MAPRVTVHAAAHNDAVLRVRTRYISVKRYDPAAPVKKTPSTAVGGRKEQCGVSVRSGRPRVQAIRQYEVS